MARQKLLQLQLTRHAPRANVEHSNNTEDAHEAKEYEYRRLIARQGHIHEHRDGRDEVHKGVHGEGELAPARATRAMEYVTHQQASQHDDRHQWGGHITGKAYRLSEAYHRSR